MKARNVCIKMDCLEAVVADHYCMQKMLGAIKEYCGGQGWEAERILNRYVMTSKSLGNDEHPAIPEFEHKESTDAFYDELMAKYPGTNLPALKDALCEIRDIYLAKYHIDRGTLTDPRTERRRGEGEFVVVSYEFKPGHRAATATAMHRGKGKGKGKGRQANKYKFDIRIPASMYERLVRQCEDVRRICAMFLRYDIITCGGKDPSQWCCSDDVFDLLSAELRCNVELFASPISRNTRIGIYGSLFHDTDRHFGSVGMYADLISEKRLSGFMQAHPPPIEMIIDDFTERALHEMMNGDRPLGFICMLPYWKDSRYMRKLTGSMHCRSVVLCTEYANSRNPDKEELVDPYFSFYAPLLNKEIPAQLDSDRMVIIVLVNDDLWNAHGVREIIANYFP